MRKGFTLIEILVVIGIVVLLTAASVTGMTASRTRRQVKTTAEKLKYTINEAIAQAKTPDDTVFGLQKIEIRVYPWDNSSSDKNKVKVYNCTTTCTENQKLSFEASKNIFFNSSQSPAQGNMVRNSTPNRPDYYFSFGVCAKNVCSHDCWNSSNQQLTCDDKIGQLTDYRKNVPPTEDSVFLRVMDNTDENTSNNVYSVRAYIDSGLVINEKIK